jgi:hypothetical protein
MLAGERYAPCPLPSRSTYGASPRLLPFLPAALCVGTVFCDWVGVTCFVDSQAVWVTLNLPSVGLLGSIPASWSRFCTLTTLVLDDNYLDGTLPAFGLEMAFPRLQYLSLQQNLFYGPLPDYYGTRSHYNCLLLFFFVYHFCFFILIYCIY